jgi:hypothetical protein
MVGFKIWRLFWTDPSTIALRLGPSRTGTSVTLRKISYLFNSGTIQRTVSPVREHPNGRATIALSSEQESADRPLNENEVVAATMAFVVRVLQRFAHSHHRLAPRNHVRCCSYELYEWAQGHARLRMRYYSLWPLWRNGVVLCKVRPLSTLSVVYTGVFIVGFLCPHRFCRIRTSTGTAHQTLVSEQENRPAPVTHLKQIANHARHNGRS